MALKEKRWETTIRFITENKMEHIKNVRTLKNLCKNAYLCIYVKLLL